MPATWSYKYLVMKTANIAELAEEYEKFKNVDEEQVDLKDHIQLYESLTNRIEQAGLSLYEVSRYVRSLA